MLNVAFLMYYVVLAIYMPLHYDDLHFMWSAQTQSLPDFLQWVYFDRSGRIAVYAASWLYGYIAQSIWSWWFMPLIMMLIGCGLCWLFVRNLPICMSKIETFLSVVFIYNLYILTCVDFAVFYWMCAMQYYLMLPALLGLISYIVQPQLKWYEWIIFGLICIAIGLGYEVWVPVVLVALLFVGLYFWRSYKWNIHTTWNDVRIKRLLVATFALIAMLLFAISSPGMWNRMAGGACEGMTQVTSIWEFVVAMGKACATFAYMQIFYTPYYLILLVIMAYFGMQDNRVWRYSCKQLIYVSTGVLLLLSLISIAPTAYAYSGFGIQRVYHPLVLLLLLYVSYTGYILGHQLKKCEKFVYWIAQIGVVLLFVIMLINMQMDFPTAKRYKEAETARFAYLSKLQQSGNKEDVMIDPMPDCTTIDVKYNVMKLFLRHETSKQALYYVSDAPKVGNHNEYEMYVKNLLGLDFDFYVQE